MSRPETRRPQPEDEKWMRRALQLARRSLGRASPNPACAALVVSPGGELVSEGIHERFGGPHAERVAIEAAGGRARGGTLYVTLEPCRHQGKTPPCTDAVIEAGLGRVVFGAKDPNPEAAGGGEILKKAGLEVEPEVLRREAREFYSYFYKHVRRGQSFLTAKWAMTADGKLATRTGDSHWVSSEESKQKALVLRAESDAVVVGVRTVLRDDPRLTARLGDGREPLRVVVDSRLRTPPEAEILKSAGRGVLLACGEGAPVDREEALRGRGAEVLRLPAPGGRVDFGALLDALHERGSLRVFIEGGGVLLGSAFDTGRVDEVYCFIAPKVVGGRQSPVPVAGRGITRMTDALPLKETRWEPVGPDLLLYGRVGEWDWLRP